MSDKIKFKLGGVFKFWCYDREGNLAWTADAGNLVVDEGLDYALDLLLGTATKKAAWYIGIVDSEPNTSYDDTLASHPGWVEVTQYIGNRKEYTPGAVSEQTINNMSARAQFEITEDNVVIGGGFLTPAETGTEDILLSVAPFTVGDKIAETGYILEVAYEFSVADIDEDLT